VIDWAAARGFAAVLLYFAKLNHKYLIDDFCYEHRIMIYEIHEKSAYVISMGIEEFSQR
jgi:hypothetical protein